MCLSTCLLGCVSYLQECPDPACLAYGDCVVCQFGTQGTGDRNCDRMCEISTIQSDNNFDRDSFMINGKLFKLYKCIYIYIECSSIAA